MAEAPALTIEPAVDTATVEQAIARARGAIRDAGLAYYSWPLVHGVVATRVWEAVCSGWLPWLAQGWGSALEIARYGRAEEVAKDSVALVKLGKHKLQGTMPIRVTVSVGGHSYELMFEVPVTAQLNAVTLSIRKGHIESIGGGECEIGLAVMFGGINLTGDLPVKTIKVPDKYVFDPPGIAIPGRREPDMIVAVPSPVVG